MKKDKRVKKEDTRKDIVVLDKGIDVDEMSGPQTVCCRAAVFPFR